MKFRLTVHLFYTIQLFIFILFFYLGSSFFYLKKNINLVIQIQNIRQT